MEYLRKHGVFGSAILLIIVIGFTVAEFNNRPNPSLKEFKDGIQNHLVFSIKGECFFVRPNDEVTVYLVRVTDCDRK